MNEKEIGKVEKAGGSRKKLIAGIVVAVIVVAGISIWTFRNNDTSNGSAGLDWPHIGVNVTKNESIYTIRISVIEYNTGISKNEAWLRIENLHFLLMSHSRAIPDLREVYYNKTAWVYVNNTTVNNIVSGNVTDVLNGSADVIFYDTDYDGFLSVNDVFIVNGSILPPSNVDPKGLFSVIYEGHKGDMDGILNGDVFISIRTLGLKNNEWWNWWEW